MSWTCPCCGQTNEDAEAGSVRFCQHCGEPADPRHAAGRLDGLLRLVMIVFGGLWLALFFIPFGVGGYGGTVMSWDLLADREEMAHLVAWPLVISLIFLVLGLVKPLPAWLRHGASMILGISALVVMFGADMGGPFSADAAFLFAAGAPWVLMFFAVGAGLLLRVRSGRSVGARVMLGVGLLLGLIAYLTEAMGDSTLVGALLYQLNLGGASKAITRVLMLLPMFVLLVATVGFRMPAEDSDPVRTWSKAVGLAMLIYLPALMLLYGLLLAAVEDSFWHFVMYLKLALYVAGFFTTLTIASAWTADFFARQVIPALRKKS